MAEYKNIEQYLVYVGRFCDNKFGQRMRENFRDLRGTSELAMLATPNKQEYEDFCKAVKAMTAQEKSNPELLTDEQIQDIAQRAGADSGNVNIFINGYILAQRNARLKQKDTEN